MYEKTIQQLAERAPEVDFPSRNFRITGRAVPVPGGEIDLLAVDDSGTEWIIELKRDRLQPASVRQVLRYRDCLHAWDPQRDLSPMVAGPSATAATRAFAAHSGVEVFVFEMEALQAKARALGISDRAARPRRSGTPVRVSVPRGPAKARPVESTVAADGMGRIDMARVDGSWVQVKELRDRDRLQVSLAWFRHGLDAWKWGG